MVFSTVLVSAASSRIDPIADSTISLDSPSSSATYLNPASSTTANISTIRGVQVDVDGSGVTSSLGSTPSPLTAHSENHSPPTIPIRTSSNSPLPSSNVSPISGPTGIDASTLQRDSKANGKPGSRSGSNASSRRLKKAGSSSNANDQVRGIEGAQTETIAERPKKRGVPKFLSILKCCSFHENAKKAEIGEKVVPADQAKVMRQTRENQTAPVVKPHAGAENSSAEETKEVDGGNIGGPPYSEHPPAVQSKAMSQPAHNGPPAEKVELQNDAGSNLDEKQDFRNTGALDEPQLVLQASNTVTAPDDPVAPVHPSGPIAANDREGVVASQAHSPDTIAPPEAMAKDPVPQPGTGDTDVTMTEALPTVPLPGEPPKSPEVRSEGQLPITLPPPPPRAAQNQAVVGVGRSQSNAAAPSERPPWLLPPLQPRFQGKKCLVLDLDETLVHSSFKVRSRKSIMYSAADVDRHYTRPISRSLSRSRVSTTTST